MIEQLICELSSKKRTVYDNNISNENSSINSVTNNADDWTNVTVNYKVVLNVTQRLHQNLWNGKRQ